MKRVEFLKSSVFTLVLIISMQASAQKPANWTRDQLIEPAKLAQTIGTGKDIPVIISVGPGATIPNSIAAGMAKEQENLDTLKNRLSGMPKDTKIVIYCGCCPFEHCPNVRPAIALLKDMKFSNYKLLDLPHNIKADWIDKGYPTSK